MPLCPQITNTPITVVLNADFTVTSVIPVLAANTEQLSTTDAAAAAAVATANAAAVTAGTAQSTANTALANAATAFTTAVNSLQPSAFAIQNPTTKQLSAIDATGLTVYVNSPTTGPRVVLNSTGLAGFDSSGSGVASFSISASTGAAVFRGNITTGATITGGTLNIAGKTIIDGAGLLTGTDVTLTGDIRATAGYFGTAINGFSINSTGLVGVGNGLIVGGTIQTSSGSNAIVLDGANNALGIKFGGSFAGFLIGIGSGAFAMHFGTSPSTTAFPRTSVSSTTASLAADGSNSLSVTTSGNNMAGTMRFFSTVQVDGTLTTNSITAGVGSAQFDYLSSSGTLRSPFTYGVARTASTRTMIIDSSGNFGTTASTRRKKHEIQSYSINSSALLNLDVKTFKYKPEFDSEQQIQHGFIAEEAQALGLDELIQYDSTGVPDYFAYEKLPIFLLQLIQELKAEIDTLKGA